MRKVIRRVAGWAAAFVWAGVILGLVQANVSTWASTYHYDTFLSGWWARMPDLAPLLSSRTFWAFVGFVSGLAIALWIVKLFPESRADEVVEHGANAKTREPDLARASIQEITPPQSPPKLLSHETRLPANAGETSATTVDPHVLFQINDNDTLYLKFLPDTQTKNEDALLLIVFGYKIIYNRDDVSVDHVTWCLQKSGCEKNYDNSPLNYSAYDLLHPIDAESVGQLYIDRGCLTKVGLSRGKRGFFKLTHVGLSIASHLMIDLINRA